MKQKINGKEYVFIEPTLAGRVVSLWGSARYAQASMLAASKAACKQDMELWARVLGENLGYAYKLALEAAEEGY